VLNLLQCVVDTLSQGGTLTLRGRRAHAQAHLDISSTDSEIPEDQLTLLCNPLSTTKLQGRGLSLYLAREIVVAHHGELTVIRAPGSGTTFTVTLPLLAVQGAPER
jgi:signal transduction histidine kinase